MSESKLNVQTLIAAIVISVIVSVSVSYMIIPSGTGELGSQGPIGETGPPGPKGEKGIQGEQGLQGEQGVQGIMGQLGSLPSPEPPPEWDATVKVLDAYSEGEHEHYYRYALSIYHRSKATLYDVKIYMPNGELLGHYPNIAPYDHVNYDDVHYQPEYVQITYYNGTANGTAKVNVVREGS